MRMGVSVVYLFRGVGWSDLYISRVGAGFCVLALACGRN